MNEQKVKHNCASCGAGLIGQSFQMGTKILCSRSCIEIHAAHYRKELLEAHNRVVRKYYGV